MKNITVIMATLCLIACGSTTKTEHVDPTQNVQILGLLFGVKFNESGIPNKIRYSKAVDTKKNTVNFILNEKLMSQAINKLKQREYKLEPNFDFSQEVFVVCIYTNVSPDKIMCGEDTET